MALSLFTSIKKKDLADFFQKMSMLLDAGYDACSAVTLLAAKPPEGKKHDKTADGIRSVATLLLPSLSEGFSLHESMALYPKYFETYVNQVEVGEAAGKTGDVLNRISDQIKNANKIMGKLKSALAYPVMVLVFTFGASAYLFTSVIPDMLDMLTDIGVAELPATTQLVMNVGDWMKQNGLVLGLLLGGGIGFLVVYSKTVGKMSMSRISTGLPLIGKVIQNNAMVLFFRNWQQMILAGAEMSVALKSAADSVTNLYIHRVLTDAQKEYQENGIPVFEALRPVFCMRELEIQTIQVAMEGNKLGKTLGILADDREFEATKSINAMTSAINPIMMAVVGAIVGVLVLSVYQPIISVSSSLG